MYKVFLLLVFSLYSCDLPVPPKMEFRDDFTAEEMQILQISDSIINNAYYGTLITLDKEGTPRARIMEPFPPEKDFTIWMATNPKSRKVTQIKNNPKATMHYFDKSTMSYVTLMGNAYLIDDEQVKKDRWKPGWEAFYPNKKEAYLLIKFIPHTLEVIAISKGYTGDKTTWEPHKVILLKR